MMKRLFLLLTLTLSVSNVLAYSIHGSSDTRFVLTCKDGTSMTSSMPPNHVTATAFCEDHGGIAAGYPKKIINTAKSIKLPASNSGNIMQDYNSTRSNRARS